MNDELFGAWLDATSELQREVYKVDYTRFSTQSMETDELPTRALIDYISWNTKAAAHELVELDNETSWKPWANDRPYVNRGEVVGEAIDVLHFVANILCAVGCTSAELNARYADKMEKNRARQTQEGGYRVTAEGVKCEKCRRALDDVMPSATNPNMCLRCEKESHGVRH